MKNYHQNNLSFYKQEFKAEALLLVQIRSMLLSNQKKIISEDFCFNFDPKVSQIYITLFQPNTKKIRWGARRKTLEDSIERAIKKLKSHKRFNEFDIKDPNKTRILFEMVTEFKVIVEVPAQVIPPPPVSAVFSVIITFSNRS